MLSRLSCCFPYKTTRITQWQEISSKPCTRNPWSMYCRRSRCASTLPTLTMFGVATVPLHLLPHSLNIFAHFWSASKHNYTKPTSRSNVHFHTDPTGFGMAFVLVCGKTYSIQKGLPPQEPATLSKNRLRNGHLCVAAALGHGW